MGGPISLVFSDVFMYKMELDVVVPATPIFCKRYVDDTYVWKKGNDVHKLFEELNSHNENITLTLEFIQQSSWIQIDWLEKTEK